MEGRKLLSQQALLCAFTACLLRAGETPRPPWFSLLYYTGDGGRGKSITILPPRGSGLAKEQTICLIWWRMNW